MASEGRPLPLTRQDTTEPTRHWGIIEDSGTRSMIQVPAFSALQRWVHRWVSAWLERLQASRRPADPLQMKTSIQVVFFVIVGTLSAVYAFLLEVRRGLEDDRFLAWLKTKRSAEWSALTRSDRFLTVRAVEILRRGPLANDAEFRSRYQMTRHGIRFFIALIIACVAIALLLLGTLLLDWNW